MTPAHRRHDISDKVWALLEKHLPGRKGGQSGVAADSRQLMQRGFRIYANRRSMTRFTRTPVGLEVVIRI